MASLLEKLSSVGKINANTNTWVSDEDANNCAVCKKIIVAGLISSNKHHCRTCGLVVCSSCSKRKVVGKRCCDICHEQLKRDDACKKLYIPLLKKGAILQKFPGSANALNLGGGGINPRLIFLSEKMDAICWSSPAKRGQVKGSIMIKDITAVTKGCETQAFIKARVPMNRVNQCFSIISNTRTLDLETPSPQIRNQWVTAVGEYTKKYKAKSPHERYMEKQGEIHNQLMIKEEEYAKQQREQRAEAIRAKYNISKKS
eukprot:g6339.t1